MNDAPHGGSLPDGWEWTTLGELGRYYNGRAFKKSEWADSGRPIIRIQNLTDPSKPFNHFRGDADEKHTVRAGDILVSWAATLGVFQWGGDEAVVNQHIFKVESDIDPGFHMWALRSALASLSAKTRGTGMVHITRGDFLDHRLPLPPFDEQRAIAAAIDEAFARIGVIEGELDAVERLRVSMCASVLYDAFARAAGAGEMRPLGEVVKVQSGAGFPKDRQGRSSGELPFAKVAEISQALLDNDGVLVGARNFIDLAEAGELKAPVLPAGTVVMAKIGEAVRTERRAILGTQATVDNNVMAWIPQTDVVLPRFLFRWAQATPLARLANATTIPSIRKSDVVALPIPVPSIEEQQAIVDVIDRALIAADRLAEELNRARRGLAQMRGSVLHSSMKGRGVDADSGDASVMASAAA